MTNEASLPNRQPQPPSSLPPENTANLPGRTVRPIVSTSAAYSGDVTPRRRRKDVEGDEDIKSPRGARERKMSRRRSHLVPSEEVEAVKAVFEEFDVDKSGKIEINELRNMLKAMGKAHDYNDAVQILTQRDWDEDGQLSFEEVLEWYAQSKREIEKKKKRFQEGGKKVMKLGRSVRTWREAELQLAAQKEREKSLPKKSRREQMREKLGLAERKRKGTEEAPSEAPTDDVATDGDSVRDSSMTEGATAQDDAVSVVPEAIGEEEPTGETNAEEPPPNPELSAEDEYSSSYESDEESEGDVVVDASKPMSPPLKKEQAKTLLREFNVDTSMDTLKLAIEVVGPSSPTRKGRHTSMGAKTADGEAVQVRREQMRDTKTKEREKAMGARGILPLSLFSCGTGMYGQLGRGNGPHDKFSARPMKIEFGSKPFSFRNVACGYTFVVVLKETGDLLSWGKGKSGELGCGEERTLSFEPESISSLSRRMVVKISTRSDHVAAATDSGQLFTWGSGANFKLGHGKQQNEYAPRMVEALKGQKVVAVACGEEHTTCVVAVAGNEVTKVFTWGNGRVGALGHGNLESMPTPMEVDDLSDARVVDIATGAHHTVVVTVAGFVYSWGLGDDGRLGINSLEMKTSPCRVDTFEDLGVFVMKISCGFAHNVALTADNQVYSWGLGHLGQLGHGSTATKKVPVHVAYFTDGKVVDVSCGQWHSAAITENDEGHSFVNTWGLGEQGQLGVSGAAPESKMFPHVVDNLLGLEPMIVACGPSYTFVSTGREVAPQSQESLDVDNAAAEMSAKQIDYEQQMYIREQRKQREERWLFVKRESARKEAKEAEAREQNAKRQKMLLMIMQARNKERQAAREANMMANRSALLAKLQRRVNGEESGMTLGSMEPSVEMSQVDLQESSANGGVGGAGPGTGRVKRSNSIAQKDMMILMALQSQEAISRKGSLSDLGVRSHRPSVALTRGTATVGIPEDDETSERKPVDAIEETFWELDKVGKGGLDRADVGAFLAKSGLPHAEEDVAAIFDRYDDNQDGIIDLPEFRQWQTAAGPEVEEALTTDIDMDAPRTTLGESDMSSALESLLGDYKSLKKAARAPENTEAEEVQEEIQEEIPKAKAQGKGDRPAGKKAPPPGVQPLNLEEIAEEPEVGQDPGHEEEHLVYYQGMHLPGHVVDYLKGRRKVVKRRLVRSKRLPPMLSARELLLANTKLIYDKKRLRPKQTEVVYRKPVRKEPSHMAYPPSVGMKTDRPRGGRPRGGRKLRPSQQSNVWHTART